ncbi:MAG: hypothetical protein ND866_16655, partial [Pyrinomonadaceae bacterium]|nr:hypothetical protein [Pyrinomonadaceae bacterium]
VTQINSLIVLILLISYLGFAFFSLVARGKRGGVGKVRYFNRKIVIGPFAIPMPAWVCLAIGCGLNT